MKPQKTGPQQTNKRRSVAKEVLPAATETAADTIRRLWDEGVIDPRELERRTGATRQAVRAALTRRKPRGAPTKDLARITIAVPPETEVWIRQQAERGQCTLGDIVHNAVVTARSRQRG